MRLIDEINSRINYLDFYGYYIHSEFRKTGHNEISTKCPFHEDNLPSFSFNIETGLWKCHADCGSGNVFTFIQKAENTTKQGAVKFIREKLNIKPKYAAKIKSIDESIIDEFNSILLKNENLKIDLLNRRGITEKTIKKYKLGYYKGRITIPVKDDKGNYVNIRRYSYDAKSTSKMLSWKAGFGEMRLYPIENIEKSTIIICEGEMDCLLLNQYGFNAVTVTSGAGSWKNLWTKLFRDKTVFLCFDIDSAGKKGAKRIAEILNGITINTYIVNLPIDEPKNGDVTNYFIDHGNSIANFKELLASVKPYSKDISKVFSDDYIPMELSIASESKNYYKSVLLKVLIAGKDLSPYLLPKKIKFVCNLDYKNSACKECPIGISGGEREVSINMNSSQILEMTKVSKHMLDTLIRRYCGIPADCTKYKDEVIEALNVEEVRIIPDIDYQDDEQKYVVRHAYFIGHGIEANRVYELKAVTIPDPKNQYVTHMIREAKKAQNSIDMFKMNSEINEQLKIFKAEN